MSLVNKPAPEFVAPAVIDGEDIVQEFSLAQYKGQKNVVFFFWPKDFTFVCPTEILAFQELKEEFAKRDTVVVGASCDTEEVHLAWLLTAKDNGGIEGVNFPLVADPSRVIAQNFGILGGEYGEDEEGNLFFEGAPIPFRATFLIDKNGVVRHETVNDFPLGRNVQETLRMVDALAHHEKHGEVCPANWEEGKDAMHATREGVAEYLSKNA